MLIEDRSAMEADWRCGMERYWLTEHAPDGACSGAVRGIVPTRSVWDLALGAAFADGIAMLGAAPSAALPEGPEGCIELVSKVILDHWGRESHDLIRGLLYGAYLHVLPRLRLDYDLLSTEGEVYYAWPAPPAPTEMLWMSRPDLVLRRKSDQTVWVPDWKTTSWKDVEWLTKWPWAIQLHLQAAAVQQTHPEWDVQGSMIFGAYKGYKADTSGLRMSPFCNIYHATLGAERLQWSAKFVRGWDTLPASAYPGGIYRWIDEMHRTFPIILAEQYPMSQPIMLRIDTVHDVAAERLHRLKRIADFRAFKLTRQEVFDHRTINCARCPYQTACWNPAIRLNPLGSGQYVKRVPNHMLERALYELGTEPLAHA